MGRYWIPRSDSGISAMIISALKMIADRIALCGPNAGADEKKGKADKKDKKASPAESE
jgi:hypothetical protein